MSFSHAAKRLSMRPMGWWHPRAIAGFDFSEGRYFLRGVPRQEGALTAVTRAAGIILPDKAGVMQSLGNNTLPRTDRGLYANGQFTNLVARRNPTVAQLTTTTNLTDADGFAGFGNSIRFPGNYPSGSGIGYQSTALTSGATYTISVLVEMEDGNPPVFGGATPASAANTFYFTLAQSTTSPGPLFYVVEHISGNVWKVSYTGTAGATPNQTGVLQTSNNQARAFRLLGMNIFSGSIGISALVPGSADTGGATLLASDIRAVQGVRPSNSEPEPFAGWEAARLDDGVAILLDFENRMRQASSRQVVSLTDASNAVVAILNTTSVGTSFRLTAGGGSDTFPGAQTGGRSRAACRVLPDGTFALAQEGQGSVTTGTKASPINLASAARLTVGNRPQLDTPWSDWIYEAQICKPLSDAELLAWVNA